MILSNKDTVVQISLNDKIEEHKPTATNLQFMYTPELPTITCNNKVDAEYIQKEINTFANKLIKDLLK